MAAMGSPSVDESACGSGSLRDRVSGFWWVVRLVCQLEQVWEPLWACEMGSAMEALLLEALLAGALEAQWGPQWEMARGQELEGLWVTDLAQLWGCLLEILSAAETARQSDQEWVGRWVCGWDVLWAPLLEHPLGPLWAGLWAREKASVWDQRWVSLLVRTKAHLMSVAA